MSAWVPVRDRRSAAVVRRRTATAHPCPSGCPFPTVEVSPLFAGEQLRHIDVGKCGEG